MHFNKKNLMLMPSRYRAHMVNSLSGFKSANLVGTIDKAGLTNLAIISSVVHLGASPALVGFIMRPTTVERHTLENIQQTKQYTINQVNEGFWQAAHQTSAKYAKNECEFEKTGLTKNFVPDHKAPFVAESHLKYSLKLQEIVPISANNTLLIIGEIDHIICDDSAIGEDGYIDIESLNTIAVSGLDSYHKTQRLSRLNYAKPIK
jgi:flavin reductase (DIM6/NTAB) family NADH-FMN oxidoreductase RutF